MKSPRLRLVAALIFPIVVLAGNAWMYQPQRSAGEEITFPIQGFDPRDLLSGHYLFYQVDYGITETNGCPAGDIAALLCLRPERRVYPDDELPESCTLYLQGDCDGSSTFNAGLERFYVPQEHALKLEEQIRDKQGELSVSIDRHGNAAIVDLLIGGKTWKEAVKD